MTRHREGHLVTAKGGNLYFQHWEPDSESRAVLLLVHGLAEHSGRYAELADYFTAAGYAVFAMDYPGHGKSDGIRGHIDKFSDYTEALDQCTDEVLAHNPGKPVFLVGHSMGGLISASFLQTEQSKFAGCVLSGAALQAIAEPPGWQMSIARLLAVLFPTMGQLQLDASGVSRDPAVVQRYRDDPLVHTGKISARAATQLFDAMASVRENAAAITLPVLILHGGEDLLTAVEGSRALHQCVSSTDKTLIVYDGLYHEIFNEPERHKVFEDVRAWLDARVPAQATHPA